MYQKHVKSIYKRLSCISSSFRSRLTHTTCINSKTSPDFSSTAGEALVSSRLAMILQACCDPLFLSQGRQVHAQIIVNGISHEGSLGVKILGMYVLCGSLVDALNIFYKLELCYSLPWKWMIRGFTMMEWFEFTLLFYFKRLTHGASPDKYTFLYVIKACSGLKKVSFAIPLHDTIRGMGFELDVFVGSSLINLYAGSGFLVDARSLFDRMHHKDIVLWNVMINGYAKNENPGGAIKLFMEMRKSEIKPNSVTFACMLSISASESMIEFGAQLHGLAVVGGVEMDSPIANTLLAMYSKCRCLPDAYKLFDMMPQCDSVSWNCLISGHVHNGFMDEALCVFHDMIRAGVKPDPTTFSSILPSISDSASLKQGKEIQGYITRHRVHFDLFLKSALIDIYFKCKDVGMARKIFNLSSSVDIVICTAMVSGYVLNGMTERALENFRWLLREKMRPNSVTLASVLPACACLGALKVGKELHGYILKNGFGFKCYVESAVVDMYAKCGRLDIANKVFRRMADKDVISWNSMISSCSQNGKPEEAISLFRLMGLESLKYDCVSISATLSACANLSALGNGKEIHCFMVRISLDCDLFTETALIDMYSKCANVDLARRVFDMMQVKNEVSWNSMISAYGNHGLLEDCLGLFHKMLGAGIRPDHVTFLAIISACGHAGEVDKGIQYFHRMINDYGITAGMEHYACMVDLYARAGRLSEASGIIKNMPFDPDAGVWGTLLGACRIHGNIELAELASSHLLDLDPQNSGYYTLLANVHADAGQWESARKIRRLMKDRGVQKFPGYSWLEVNGTSHVFVAGDSSHPQSAQIYFFLKHLLLELRKEGYVSQYHSTMQPQLLGLQS